MENITKTQKIVAGIVLAFVLLCGLTMCSTCSRKPQVVYQQAPVTSQPAPVQEVQHVQPQVIYQQAPPAQHSATGDAFTGAAAGAVVGNMISGAGSRPAPTVVHRTTVINRPVVRQVYRPSYRSSYRPSSFRRR